MPDTIYYFEIDAEGNEIGEPHPVTLKPDGTADVSALPDRIRDLVTTMGVPDVLHQGFIHPEQGESFLKGLLRWGNPYARFRVTPERV